jgi:hypothetical protein
MRRISIVIVLSTLLLVSICSAQQKPDNKDTNPGQSASPIGIDGAVIGGNGTVNYIPIWTTPNYLQSSVIYQASGGNIGIGTTTPVNALDVNGGINAARTYGIAGATVVNIGSPADGNLFLGVGAGQSNVAGEGVNNTFSGIEAGYSNTAGTFNTFSGAFTGYRNTTGNLNTFSGLEAGGFNTAGSYNTFSGVQAGVFNTTGDDNTFVGYQAGYYNQTGNNNIYIASIGPSSGTESNTIRIGGNPLYGPQTAAYILGIYGSTSSGGIPVYVNSFGQLGTSPSSLRFKEQVRDMGDSSNALMKLRPVTFLYKPEYANGERTLQYGLIAEEVAKVYPDLVAYDNDGKPYTVRYQYLATMLLNEVQKQYHRTEAQAELIKAQQQEIEDLKQQLQVQNATLQQRLSRLEALARVEVAAAK